MFRPRLRLRTLLIAVVLAGLAFGSARWIHRMRTASALSRWLANAHRTMERTLRSSAEREEQAIRVLLAFDREKPIVGELLASSAREGFEQYSNSADHHAKLAEKYERAARFPWLLPDPPPHQ